LLQYFVRSDRLDAITFMRSNDIYLGLPHDVFTFTMIQEIIARSLGVELGTYIHMIGSLHLYEKDDAHMRAFIDEGWQSHIAMAPMPAGDPWPSLRRLLGAESELREGVDYYSLDYADAPYWQDLVRILAMFGLEKQGRQNEIQPIRAALADANYEIFLTDRYGML
jgi:thymidylate synthase